MSVELDPPTQLSFRRPLTTLVKEILHVRNSSSQPVAFKVKTTAPKQYCVRPNSGRIEPDSEVEVQVLLQAMREDPPLDFKCKDKFLVQSISIKPEWESLQLQDLWSIAEEETKNNIKEKKVKCVYLPPIGYDNENSGSPPPGNLAVPFGSNRSSTTYPQLSNKASINGLNETFHASSEEPRASLSTLSTLSTSTSTTHEKKLDEGPSSRPQRQSQAQIDVTTSRTSSSPRPSSSILSSKDSPQPVSDQPSVDVVKLEKDLTTAHSTITRLETLLDQYKKDIARAREDQAALRQRISNSTTSNAERSYNKRLSTAEKAAALVSPHDAVHQVISSMRYPPPVEGYPPAVVGVVAFLVFIFTWLFF